MTDVCKWSLRKSLIQGGWWVWPPDALMGVGIHAFDTWGEAAEFVFGPEGAAA